MEIFKCTLSKVEIFGVLHNIYIYENKMWTSEMKIKWRERADNQG